MALLKEHFRFGLIFGGVTYIMVFAVASYLHLFENFYTLLFSFILGFIAIVAGSLIPDMDAPRSPVHDVFMVLFGGIAATVGQNFVSTPAAILAASFLTVYADRNYLPSHRGTVHTIGGAVLFGVILTGSLYIFLTRNPVVCIWSGFSFALGHSLHLFKDGCMKLR